MNPDVSVNPAGIWRLIFAKILYFEDELYYAALLAACTARCSACPRGLCVWLAPPGAAELRRLQRALRGGGSVKFGVSGKVTHKVNELPDQ